MQLPGPPPELPGEREVLYLADKRTVGSRAVDLDARRERAEALLAVGDPPDAALSDADEQVTQESLARLLLQRLDPQLRLP